ncbi:DUF3885 domain-containing protein [Oxalobacteraceae bacterium OTU3CAMAD1]|nr:DUF3885 domain-containing protein [Oxalobacteraceae bacterium OTU3CAMAD1]
MDQALTALRKATAICNDVFDREENILVHLQAFASTSRFGLRQLLRDLQVAGIIVPERREFWLEGADPVEEPEDGEGNCWVNCAFEVAVSKLQNLLWCAVATDFGSSLAPNPRCRVYLLNLNREIVVHPYDDRGMDVISLHTSALAELYERHIGLLLDYDMEAMQQTFGR